MSDLARLERLRFEFSAEAARAKRALVARLARTRLGSAAAVRRLHEVLLFLCAYADDAALRTAVERALTAFAARPDLRRFKRALESSGIAGTDLRYPFYQATAARLARAFPARLEVAWESLDDAEEQRLLDRLDLDPQALAELERRLSDIHDLARKHRTRAEALPARLAELRAELEAAENAAGGAERLRAQQSEVETRYRTAAAKLGKKREKAAKDFADKVTQAVRKLGMPNSQFVVAIEPAETAAPSPHGSDVIRFDFSANPGQPPRPMAKVASGGELSRLSLAVQVVCRSANGAATMIFDEVDAGIGGGVAEIVGQQLRALGASRQVLCVTHLAQVAAQGTRHFGIFKEIRGGMTYTRLRPLDDADRIGELARMMGGVEITASTQAHARELLQRAAT